MDKERYSKIKELISQIEDIRKLIKQLHQVKCEFPQYYIQFSKHVNSIGIKAEVPSNIIEEVVDVIISRLSEKEEDLLDQLKQLG